MLVACRLVVALAVGGLVCPPVYADVMPTRRVPAEDTAPAKVESRLLDLGLGAAEARAQVRDLTGAEARYFAQNPERLQLVGQEIWAGQSDNLWWEWIGGLALLAGVTYAIWIFAKNNDKED
jgi:hypothetical protein